MSTSCEICERPTGDDTTICARCAQHLQDQLREVPAVAADILTTRTGQRAAPMTLNRKSADRPLPIRPDAGRGLDERRNRMATAIVRSADAIARAAGRRLEDELADRQVRESAAEARADRNPDPAALTGEPVGRYEVAAMWMAGRPKDLRRHPDAARMYAAITETLAEARAVTDEHRPTAYKGPCPQCGTGLYAHPGSPAARCQRCRAEHSTAQLDAENLARARDTLVTIPEAVRLLADLGQPIPRSTIYAWRAQRRIVGRGYRHDERTIDRQIDVRDPAVYRLAEILDAAARPAA